MIRKKVSKSQKLVTSDRRYWMIRKWNKRYDNGKMIRTKEMMLYEQR